MGKVRENNIDDNFSFDDEQDNRVKEHDALEKKVTNAPPARTVMSLSISKEDKKFLQRFSLDHNATSAAVIHELLELLRKDENIISIE
ncbi:MAG: hypothetical protein IKF90_10285 [Parasporobacterium sp.]|nr:hypothetical protein [Parasporobacterium sp.]